ncbi:MAG: UPF0182 family protein [Methylococcales bacterium]
MRKLTLFPALIGVTLVAVIVFFAFHFIFRDFFVDLWWYQSLNIDGYFWLRLLYKFFIFGGVTLFFFAIFFSHFWFASRYIGLNPTDEIVDNVAKRLRFQRIADLFMNWSIKIYTPISLILAIFVAMPFYKEWKLALLFFFSQNSGVTESIYGNDVSFYMFSYPMYMLIQQELLITATLIFFFVGILYWLEHIFVPNQRKEYHTGAKAHLTTLIGFVVIFVVWGFLLERFSLLHTNAHEPIFYGPGTIEIRYRLPILWLGIATFVATAISASLFIFSPKHRIKAPFLVSLLAFLFMLVLSKVEFLPQLIEKFIVIPNPVATERPFMQANIDSTLKAYNLDNITVENLDIKQDATEDIKSWATQKRFENIPIWDREFLIHAYQQLQEIRPYYHFNSVDEDRYDLLGHIRQVNLAAREINISKLPMAAQNWENTHLRYTHGVGAVVSPAAQDAGKPLVWYLRDLNMNSDVSNFTIKNPDIYFGEAKYNYAIVPNNLKVLGIESSDQSEEHDYTGKGGIPISNIFKKALFSIYFNDLKIFFSPNITDKSQLMIRRNIVERVHHIAPFLQLDKDPYLVGTKDRFYWILDAYTISNWYPLSKPAADDYLASDEKFNYIRNSVKVVVDAFDGTVDFYLSDPSDAIIQTYNRAFPGLLKDLSTMPKELRAHLRYPRDLFYMQMKIYAKYHQTSPDLFYEQGETWQFANVRGEPVMPYYQTMDFPVTDASASSDCKDQEEFVMINPMTPINRNNLSMIGVASILDKTNCALDYKPNIRIYKFGKDVQVNGPAQVEALINQNAEISEKLTLWDQHGSKVELGRMIILPMGNTILYVQPVYLTSINNQIPELTRMIVSMGNQVVWDTSLWSAFGKLEQLYAKTKAEQGGTGTRPKQN